MERIGSREGEEQNVRERKGRTSEWRGGVGVTEGRSSGMNEGDRMR